MSKSPNIFIPAIGGAALVLGVAYGVTSRDYGADEIAMLETRVAQAEASAVTARDSAAQAKEQAAELTVQIADVQATANLTAPAPQNEEAYRIGRAALPEEIAAWDVDVLPDGRGLPAGSGDVLTGEEVFVDRCASCHGDFAEGVDNWPVLAGGFDTLADADPVKTVGSYWPYLSTSWDYINRSMPFGEAGTLTADETYAIVAYLMYSNDMVDDDFVLSQDNFADVEMHNASGFITDDREAREYAAWQTEPCMENCKQEVEVTMRSVFLVDTPIEGGTESVMNNATAEGLPTFTADGPSFIPVASTAPAQTEDADPAPAQEPADDSAVLLAAGEKLFRRCSSCHEVGAGADNKSGPQLNGILGRAIGSVDGFRYSNVFADANAEGRVWDAESLAGFIENPKSYFPGTKMSFRGLSDKEDQDALIEYLKTASE